MWSLPPSSWAIHRQLTALVKSRDKEYVFCRPGREPNPDHWRPQGTYESFEVTLMSRAHRVYTRSELQVDPSLGAAPKVWKLGKALARLR
jgi:hypothetical protein